MLWLALLTVSTAQADESTFVIKDIRIEGLQRISAGAVFNVLPLQVGDKVNATILARAARILYKTGNFQDIKIERDGDVLVFLVSERPSITKIKISGNKSIY